MPKPTAKTNKELIDLFLKTPITILNGSNSIIAPADGMLYNMLNQRFYYYDLGAWIPLITGDMRTGTIARMLEFFLTDTPDIGKINTTTSKIIDLQNCLIRRFPHRLELETKEPPLVALLDQTLNLETGALTPHNPDDHCLFKLSFHSDELNAPTPHFDHYVKTAFPDEPEMKTLLLEVVLHYINPNSNEPAAFYLYGRSRTGKSKFLDFMEALIGEDERSAHPLHALTGQNSANAVATLKKINIVDEDESTHIKADKLKALISNNAVSSKILYQDLTSRRPHTKYLFGSNEYPKIVGAEGGLLRRLHFIEYKHEIPTDKIIKDFEKLLIAETPGILKQAIEAGKGFRSRNQEFSFTPSMIETKADFFKESSPALSFIEEECTVGDHHWTSNREIYRHYGKDAWCDRNGYRALSVKNFFTQIDRALNLKEVRVGNVRGRPLKLINNPPQV